MNGTSRHVAIVSTRGEEECPLCQSPITREQFEQIVRIDEARRKQLADEHAAVEHERQEVAQERTKIAADAIAAERARSEAALAKAEREAERARKQAETEQARLTRQHEKEIQAEVRKREVSEKQRVRELAAAEAKATREAKRAIAAEVVDLRAQLKTSEGRRRRDEEVMKQTIADLARKAEDRDRGHFGAEGEEDLLHVLRERFPSDKIEHRGKQGDVLMTVIDGGKAAARIIFEVKNTKSWQRDYWRQTKQAMETHGTRYGFLVTRALPAGHAGLCMMGGVIIAVPAIAAQVVTVLRDAIVSIFRLNLSEDGKSAKMEALFAYLRGDDFRAAVQRVQEKIVELRESLTREKSHHDGWWSARENHYATILRAAAGIDARVNDLLGAKGDPA